MQPIKPAFARASYPTQRSIMFRMPLPVIVLDDDRKRREKARRKQERGTRQEQQRREVKRNLLTAQPL